MIYVLLPYALGFVIGLLFARADSAWRRWIDRRRALARLRANWAQEYGASMLAEDDR